MTDAQPQSAAYFESLYRGSKDPWDFASSPYELGRYHAILTALHGRTYRRAFEPGCSIGVLTKALAAQCTRVIACDISPSAVALARERCSDLPNVDIDERDVCEGPPAGTFDLIVLSEIGYYLSAAKLCEIALALTHSLEPNGEFIAVHWLGDSPDHQLHGNCVHDLLIATLPCDWITSERHAGFRLDAWRRHT
jgi:SAM-dependent methyltransferase